MLEGAIERLCAPSPWTQGFLKIAKTLEVHACEEKRILAAPGSLYDSDARWVALNSDDCPTLVLSDDMCSQLSTRAREAGPVIRRLPRRAWRVTYLRGPFKHKKAIRHYVFHDWRYEFEFHNPSNAEETVSRLLGSAAPDTSSVVHFSWHCQSDDSFMIASPQELEAGRQGVLSQVHDETERKKGWYRHSLYWNGVGKQSG